MMNRRFVYIVQALLAMFVVACSGDENKIIDNSTDRVDAAVRQYDEQLTGGGGEWIMVYYPNPEAYGGVNLHMHFGTGNRVAITAETPFLSHPGEVISSLYQWKGDQGPVLSFDTYNRVLHQFSDPEPDGKGYEGDYEFVIEKSVTDTLFLRGKKSGVKMYMRRLQPGESWSDMNEQICNVTRRFPGLTLQVEVDGTAIDANESSRMGRYLTFQKGGVALGTGRAFIYTVDGIQFREPVQLEGHAVRNFVLSDDGQRLISREDPRVSIRTIGLGEAFVRKSNVWYLDGARMGPRFTLMWNDMIKRLDKELDEEFLYGVLMSRSRVFMSYCYSRLEGAAYPAYFYMDFRTAEEPDQLKVIFEGTGDDMAKFIYFNYFRSFLDYMTDDEPYDLVYDNLKIPSELTLRRGSRPDYVWFTLTKQ